MSKEPAQRTLEQVNLEYNQEAGMAGHKGRIVKELLEQCDEHFNKMKELSSEAQVLAKEVKEKAPITPEAVKPLEVAV